MECNRDEAARAKAIAEKRFTRKDIFGAKKFALKAQGLYPELEGIQQMIATFDLYIAAENKLHGDLDWYAILNVHPSADDDTVRKHYRKLALLLHPDKNKTIGAEGAFKVVSQAWSLLSDKGKRASYDLKRHTSVPFASPANNGLSKFAKAKAARGPKGGAKVPSSNPKSKQATFWTACYRCKMQYEYLRKHLNNNLLCPNCHKAFFAIETAPPRERAVKSPTAQWSFSQQQQKSAHQSVTSETRNSGRNKVSTLKEESENSSGPSSVKQLNFQWNAFAGSSSASTPAKAAVMVQQAYETVKREREEAQAAKKREEAQAAKKREEAQVAKRREEALRRKANATKWTSSVHQGSIKRKRNTDDAGTSSHGNETANHVGVEVSGGTSKSKLDDCTPMRTDGLDEPKGNLRYILIEKARKDIKRIVDTSIKMKTENESMKKQRTEEKENKDVALEAVHNKSINCSIRKDNLLEGVNRFKLSEISVSKFIYAPDPNFCVFDKDRNESCFEEGQVWAAYDSNDGMPRFYAVIHKVLSRNPFKMQISWLNSNLGSDMSLLNGVGSDFVKGCGEFRAGNRFVNVNARECFSHKVRWGKAKDGMIQILPRKGDVWALYRNWSPEWNELTTDETITKYDLVEVLTDLTEEGIIIIPLVKVARFETIFHRHLDLRQIRTVPKEETSRFSHYVPSRLLTGAESQSVLKGCHELDPAAVPSKLLQTFTDITEDEIATLLELNNLIEMDDDDVMKTNEADMVQHNQDRIQLNLTCSHVLDDQGEDIMDKGFRCVTI